MSYPNSQSCWCAILGRDTAGAPLLSDEQGAADVLLPHRPCATDHLERGRYRMSGDDALTRRYLEHCPHALLGSIVTGCDHPDAALRAVEKPSGHPAPNRVARSPFRAGAPGLGWWLGDNGVCRTDSARLTPLRYAHRLEKGLCISVGGDFAYGGQLTTNPIHPDWDTRYGRADPYAFCRDAPAPRSIVLLRPYVAV